MSFFADELESARFAAHLRREVDEIAKVYVQRIRQFLLGTAP